MRNFVLTALAMIALVPALKTGSTCVLIAEMILNISLVLQGMKISK